MADISYARPIEFVRACDDYSSAQVTSVSGSVNPLDVYTKPPLTTKQALSVMRYLFLASTRMGRMCF
jgi:hypothetical protein